MSGLNHDTTPDHSPAALTAGVEGAPLERPHTVGAIIQSNPRSCRSDESLKRCALIIWDECGGAVPVVDDADRPIAMVTDRDLAMALYLQGKTLEATRVDSAMSKGIFTAHVAQSISSAEGIMRRHAVRSLPVVDDERRLVGIVSIDDIARHISVNSSTADPLSPQAFAATVAAL